MDLGVMKVQLAGAVEYTDCISAEGYDAHNECSDIRQFSNQVESYERLKKNVTWYLLA